VLRQRAGVRADSHRDARLLRRDDDLRGLVETADPSASASSSLGTATRTISQPAEASAAICAVVASTSCVFVSVIDWTTTGAPPPIVTPPTSMEISLAMRLQGTGALRE